MGIRRLVVLLGLAFALPVYGGTVSGRIADNKGNPVGGARVVWYAYRQPERALLERTKGTVRTPLGESKTDASGSFKVTFDKPSEGISLEVSAAGLPSIELDGPYDPAEQSTDIECLLPVSERVSGRFVDETNKPLAGVRVRASAGAESQDTEGDGTAFQEAVSRADGTFLLENAPKGAVFRAELSGFALLTAFGSRSSAPMTLILKRGGSIEGRVVDPSGHPAAGVVILGAGFAVETDEQGNYRIPAVAPAQASVSLTWKDDLAARRDSIPIRRGETTRVDLSLLRSAIITGSAIDSRTRRPIAGVRVTMSEGGPAWAPVSGRSSRTDAQGRFRVAGLVPRSYRVTATHRDYQPAALLGVRTSIAAPGNVALALQKSIVVTGRVVDEKSSPVPGARVSVLSVPFGRRALLKGITKPPSTKTLPDGSFRLRGVVPDPAVSIEARKEGFVTAQRHGLPGGEGGPKPVTVVLRRGLEARGSVVDSQGLPVVGAELRLQRKARSEASMNFYSEPGDRAAPAAVSDAQGRLSVTGLEAGDFTGRLSREGYATKVMPLLQVKTEEVTSWAALTLEASALVAGFVRDRNGDPIGGAQVFSYASEMSNSATTDLQGHFRLDGYPAGKSVTIQVTATGGYARTQASATAPAESLAIVLPTTGELRGRVEDAETRAPLEAFFVQVTAGRNNPYRGGFGSEIQSPDGSFLLPNVPPGKIDVSGSAAGYLETTIAGIELAEGESREGIVLSLKRGRDVTGRVLDPARGSGVANATVSWRREHDSGSEGFTTTAAGTYIFSPHSATTDADGRFHYEGLPPERLVMTAFHPDYQETSKAMDVGIESSIDVTLGTGASLAGTVLDRDGRTPVVGAEVALEELGASSSSWRTESARSDGSGRFRFEHMKEGRFRVSARSESGRSPAREVVLGPEQRTEDVLLQFSSGARVRGRVTGLPAGKLGGLNVFASSRDFQARTATSEDGSFLFEDVPPGPLRVSANTGSPGRAVTKGADVPESGGEISIEIVFEAGSKLTGHVLRADKAVAGVFVSATPDPAVAGLARAMAQTDMDGRYEIEGLPDGSYRMQFSGSGVNAIRRVAVSGDTSFDAVLGGSVLSGVVTDAASGEPVSEARIRAEKGADVSGFSAPSAVSDSKGYFSVSDLEPGTYQVTAQRNAYQTKSQTVSVGEASAEANFALSRGAGLRVTALDGASGLPLKGLDIAVLSTGSPAFQGSVPLDGSGQGETPALPAGRYTLQFFSAGYAPRILSAVDVPGQPLTIAMTLGGRVEIRTDTPSTIKVLTAAGILALRSPWFLEGTGTASPPVSALGAFEPGSYVLVVTGPGPGKSYPFRVAEGQTTTVSIGP